MTYSKLFQALTDNLNTFLEELKKHDLRKPATDKWDVKGVLCHLVFWHENYAANYKALSENKTPPLLDGPTYQFNLDSVKSLEKESVKNLIKRLKKANDSLKISIVEKKVPQMTYKKGGRTYKTNDFLIMISHHFLTHLKQIKKNKTQPQLTSKV